MKKNIFFLLFIFSLFFTVPYFSLTLFGKVQNNNEIITEKFPKQNNKKIKLRKNQKKNKNFKKNCENKNEDNFDVNSVKDVVVYDHKNDKVFKMNLEEYMVGVLIGEIPASFELEALKAQAVAARSYILDKVKTSRKCEIPGHKGAEICTDHRHCKEWMSPKEADEKWGSSWSSKYLKKMKSAVESTRGEYLTYNGTIAKAFFFAMSGGTTETPHDVWGGGDYPYLVSVESPYDKYCKDFITTIKLTKEEFLRKLKEARASFVVNDLSKEIEEISHTTGGAVAKIKIGNEIFKGTEIGWIFHLKSANFTINFNNSENTVYIVTKGYGHGVGMSQHGAHEYAKRGSTYKEILEHYYQGVTLQKIKK